MNGIKTKMISCALLFSLLVSAPVLAERNGNQAPPDAADPELVSQNEQAESWYRESVQLQKAESFTERARLLKQAAEAGHPIAQNNLGVAYRKGQGVPLDYAKSFYWCDKSARQGLPMGQFSLGLLYKEGLGVEQSDIEAFAWWGLAADAGNPEAKEALIAVQEELGRDDEKMGAVYRRIMELGSALHKR